MNGASITVAALNATPVKGLRIARHNTLELTADGVRGDRLFYVLDVSGRMVNGKQIGELQQVTAELIDGGSGLAFTFPAGEPVAGAIELGEELDTMFFSRTRRGRLLTGEFSAALSAHAGQALRVVGAADGTAAIDRGERGAVSMISRSSVAVLEGDAGVPIDPRRFRMSIELDGVPPLAEDRWIGAELAVGEARIVPRGHVGRCLVTSRDPDSGRIDLPTLDRLRDLRAHAATSEPLALGIYGEIRRPGTIRVGDAVVAV